VKASRAADFGAYILIAFAFAGLAIFFASRNIDPKWMALVFESALVFGTAIVSHKVKWRLLSFWACLLLILLAHICLSALVLQHLEKVRGIWVALTFVIETAIAIEILERLTRKTGWPKRHDQSDR
jgi:hypothetical protein